MGENEMLISKNNDLLSKQGHSPQKLSNKKRRSRSIGDFPILKEFTLMTEIRALQRT